MCFYERHLAIVENPIEDFFHQITLAYSFNSSPISICYRDFALCIFGVYVTLYAFLTFLHFILLTFNKFIK